MACSLQIHSLTLAAYLALGDHRMRPWKPAPARAFRENQTDYRVMESLAKQLGSTAHIVKEPEDLEDLAIVRGCRYYDSQGRYNALKKDPRFGIARTTLNNAELGIALLSPRWPESPLRVRLAAALLASKNVTAKQVADLAEEEDCEALVYYLAKCGREVEPKNSFWSDLLACLNETESRVPPRLHSSRFYEMTGITRNRIATEKRWIRPVERIGCFGQ